jgi:molybdopterin-containing oxidoreductase family iron-sulfur binding subunit
MHGLPDDQAWIKVHEFEDAAGQTICMPQPCMQCQEPPCLNVCPVGATYKAADGVVLVDQDRCIGCRMCMAACPYDARTFNWDEPPPVANATGEPSPEFPVPQQKGTVGKCVLCVHDIRYGKLPACVDACNMGTLYIGDLKRDLATNGRETVKLSELMKNDVFRYKEDLNTQPRVYYIPGHGQDSD